MFCKPLAAAIPSVGGMQMQISGVHGLDITISLVCMV